MRYEPLAHRVILREIEETKTTKGGLWVPDVARRNKSVAFGEVIAVGTGRLNAEGKLVPVHVKVGDVVIFPRQAPAVLPLDNEEVLMLAETDIIAKVFDLPKESHIVDLGGAPLSFAPQSMALPDLAYRNRDDLDRTYSDLKQSGAPPDVLADVAAQNTDAEVSELD